MSSKCALVEQSATVKLSIRRNLLVSSRYIGMTEHEVHARDETSFERGRPCLRWGELPREPDKRRAVAGVGVHPVEPR